MIALYPGSFDPPHRGHLDLIGRAAGLCQHLVVGIALNPDKRPFATVERRLAWLRADCAAWSNVEVASYAGATVAFARSRGCGVLVRGLRHGVDLEAERGQAAVNREPGGLDTLFLITSSACCHISSDLVRKALAAGLPITGLVSPRVAGDLAAEAAARPDR